MDRIVVIENFLDEDECKYALDTADYSFIKFKLDRYIKFNIKLKGYSFTELSPLKLTRHISGVNDSNWVTDSNSYISFLLQLNEDYFRGRFQFLIDDDDKYFQLPHGAGNLVVYFSNIKNRTTPVENGMKYTIASSVNIIKEEDFKKTLI